MELDLAIDAFIAYCRVERGLSRNTILAYSRDLQDFAEWLEKVSVTGVTPDALTGYISHINTSRRLAPATVRRRIASLRRFTRFLESRHFVEKDPFPPRLRAPRSQPIPKALATNEVEALLAAPDTNKPLGVRDRALLETLYASGMRISECCGLTLADVDLNAGFARVHGKGGKVRICPLGDFAVEWLGKYINVIRPNQPRAISSRRVFLSRKGELSRVQAYRLVRSYAAAVGITVAVSPHMLRHSFATHLLERGADIRVVRELLGHSRIATVEFYTRVLMSKLRDVYSLAHPHG
jgi:integrase/recombinase XerD